jgi:hypothetical protein
MLDDHDRGGPAPCAKPAMRPESRDALLTAIAKARGWIDNIRLGRIASFAGIAEREAPPAGSPLVSFSSRPSRARSSLKELSSAAALGERPMPADLRRPARALLSVSDKTSLAGFPP